MLNNAKRLLVFLPGMALLLGCCGAANAATPMVAAGTEYAIALKADGTIATWGRNDYGQLGNGQAAMRVTPAKVDGIDHVTVAIAGNSSTLVLRDDGTVWGWGGNGNGQLGDGTTQSKSHPVQVTGLTGKVKSISTNNLHVLAVTTDGNVWSWGQGLNGQLGYGGTGYRTSAAKVAGLPAVANVAAGAYHSLALASDGTVWAWGDNSSGQLGNGTTNRSLIPVQVSSLSNIVAISTTASSNLALDTSGRIWAWGKGSWGALGNGGYSDCTTPFVVPGLPQITAIVAGNRVSVATAVDGSVWMWGDNETGQFGDSAYSAQPSPAKVPALSGLFGFSVGQRHVVARSAGGALLAWGENSYGQLGVGDANDRPMPTPVSAPVQLTQASAGLSHTVAIASDGSVWTWGANGDGELADGTASVSNRPINAQGPGNTVAVAAGAFHALALDSDGSVWAWGANSNGALGNGNRRDSALPLRIPSLPAMSSIAAGYDFSLALEQNGSVWSWGGSGTMGKLGNGQTATAQFTPAKLTTISGVMQLSAKYEHVLAARQDGSVWAWGSNTHGQLGDGTTTNRSTPTQVNGLSNVVAVTAGSFHSLALDRSGNVWAWGYNWWGQLGDGTDIDRYTPVRVAGLSDVVAISAGSNSSYAITRDGRLWAWGQNLEGELGTGLHNNWNPLVSPIEGLAGFQGVAGGVGSAVALRTDGTVWAWGRNFEGQLGDATFAQSNTPVLTVNATIDGPLDLNPQVAKTIPPGKTPPFFPATYRAGDLSKFTVSTTTKFNAADIGKPGAVFVTAMVPSGSLSAAQLAMIGSNASRTKVRAASDTDSFVLMQLTPSGWQPVLNGQLIPYASGVLGDQLAAQTILNGTDTTNLNGAAYCVGYGTSAAAMAAAGTIRTVVTIPDPDATSAATMSCIIHPNYSDSWWNASESGWGITITDHGTSAFVQWYTYDQTGHNQKYVFSGTFSSDKCQLSGNVSQVSGPSWTLPSFDPNLVARRTTGTGAIDFCPAGLATGTIVFNYSNVDGVTGSKQLTRLPFGDDVPHWGGVANTGAADFTDLWWNPNESGWGVSATQHGNNLVFRIFVYDDSSRPLLFVVPSVTFNSTTSFTGAVALTAGPWFGSNPFDPNQVVRTTTPGNTATLTFSDANNGVLTYTVNGVTKTKLITRLAF